MWNRQTTIESMSSFVNKGKAPKPKGAGRRRVPLPPAASQLSVRLSSSPAPGGLSQKRSRDHNAIDDATEADRGVDSSIIKDAPANQQTSSAAGAKRRRIGDAVPQASAGAERLSQPESAAPEVATFHRSQEVLAKGGAVRSRVQHSSVGPPQIRTTSSVPGRETRSRTAGSQTAAQATSTSASTEVPALESDYSDRSLAVQPVGTASTNGPQIVPYEVPSDPQWTQEQPTPISVAPTTKGRVLRGGRKGRTKTVIDKSTDPDSSLPSMGILTPEIMAAGRTRKTRKDKGVKRRKSNMVQSETATPQTEEIQAQPSQDGVIGESSTTSDDGDTTIDASRPKAKTQRRKRTTKAASNPEPVLPSIETDVNGHESAQTDATPKVKKPRKKRGEEKLAIGESIMMDPNTITMHSISLRNIGNGEKSQREKAMEQIDWSEVKTRRREEERYYAMNRGRHADDLAAEANQSGEDDDEDDVDAQLARAIRRGPKKRTKVIAIRDGMQVFDDDTNRVDRGEMADAEVDLNEVEEDDLTHKFNSHSFQSLHRKDPAERVRNYDRWTMDMTDRFYECLSRYGTDFMIISRMMPGRTRREIKAKFTREEKNDIDRVEDAIRQSLKAADTWDLDHYKQHARVEEDQLRDPKQLKVELEKMKEERQVQIVEAKTAREEEKRQKALAGVEDSDDEGEEQEVNNEDGGTNKKIKKKKKDAKPKKTKTKKVAKHHNVGFTGVEETVEVLEELAD